MDKITYLFDVDGTLTKPTQKMDTGFTASFLSWMNGKRVFLAAGSNIEKIQGQLPFSVLGRLDGIFCCMGNEFWQNNKLIYQNEFDVPFRLKEMLTSFQMYTSFPIKVKEGGRGKIFEHRAGMLNFTTIGRNAGIEERNKYYKWDEKHGERKRIAFEVEDQFPDLEARLGGQISIDIQPKGNNKSQASQWVRKNIGGEIIFVGDKCFKGGNDYDIVFDLIRNQDGLFFQVDSPDETEGLLIDLK
jgi:phosphomannomutase